MQVLPGDTCEALVSIPLRESRASSETVATVEPGCRFRILEPEPSTSDNPLRSCALVEILDPCGSQRQGFLDMMTNTGIVQCRRLDGDSDAHFGGSSAIEGTSVPSRPSARATGFSTAAKVDECRELLQEAALRKTQDPNSPVVGRLHAGMKVKVLDLVAQAEGGDLGHQIAKVTCLEDGLEGWLDLSTTASAQALTEQARERDAEDMLDEAMGGSRPQELRHTILQVYRASKLPLAAMPKLQEALHLLSQVQQRTAASAKLSRSLAQYNNGQDETNHPSAQEQRAEEEEGEEEEDRVDRSALLKLFTELVVIEQKRLEAVAKEAIIERVREQARKATVEALRAGILTNVMSDSSERSLNIDKAAIRRGLTEAPAMALEVALQDMHDEDEVEESFRIMSTLKQVSSTACFSHDHDTERRTMRARPREDVLASLEPPSEHAEQDGQQEQEEEEKKKKNKHDDNSNSNNNNNNNEDSSCQGNKDESSGGSSETAIAAAADDGSSPGRISQHGGSDWLDAFVLTEAAAEAEQQEAAAEAEDRFMSPELSELRQRIRQSVQEADSVEETLRRSSHFSQALLAGEDDDNDASPLAAAVRRCAQEMAAAGAGHDASSSDAGDGGSAGGAPSENAVEEEEEEEEADRTEADETGKAGAQEQRGFVAVGGCFKPGHESTEAEDTDQPPGPAHAEERAGCREAIKRGFTSIKRAMEQATSCEQRISVQHRGGLSFDVWKASLKSKLYQSMVQPAKLETVMQHAKAEELYPPVGTGDQETIDVDGCEGHQRGLEEALVRALEFALDQGCCDEDLLLRVALAIRGANPKHSVLHRRSDELPDAFWETVAAADNQPVQAIPQFQITRAASKRSWAPTKSRSDSTMEDEGAWKAQALEQVKNLQESLRTEALAVKKAAKAHQASGEMVQTLRRGEGHLIQAMRNCRVQGLADEQVYQDAQVFHEKLAGLLLELQGSIRVFCRIRALKDSEMAEGQTCALTALGLDTVSIHAGGTEERFVFDSVFLPGTQEELLRESNDLIQQVGEGGNAVVISYGASGARKSFLSPSKSEGGISYLEAVAMEVFTVLESCGPAYDVEIVTSGLEVFDDVVVDLLGSKPSSGRKTIRGRQSVPGGVPFDAPRADVSVERNGSVGVSNYSEEPVFSASEVNASALRAANARSVAVKGCASQSSHFVVILRSRLTHRETGEKQESAVIFVHLAPTDEVIKHALGGAEPRGLFVASCAPGTASAEESLACLRFASRAKSGLLVASTNVVDCPAVAPRPLRQQKTKKLDVTGKKSSPKDSPTKHAAKHTTSVKRALAATATAVVSPPHESPTASAAATSSTGSPSNSNSSSFSVNGASSPASHQQHPHSHSNLQPDGQAVGSAHQHHHHHHQQHQHHHHSSTTGKTVRPESLALEPVLIPKPSLSAEPQEDTTPKSQKGRRNKQLQPQQPRQHARLTTTAPVPGEPEEAPNHHDQPPNSPSNASNKSKQHLVGSGSELEGHRRSGASSAASNSSGRQKAAPKKETARKEQPRPSRSSSSVAATAAARNGEVAQTRAPSVRTTPTTATKRVSVRSGSAPATTRRLSGLESALGASATTEATPTTTTATPATNAKAAAFAAGGPLGSGSSTGSKKSRALLPTASSSSEAGGRASVAPVSQAPRPSKVGAVRSRTATQDGRMNQGRSSVAAAPVSVSASTRASTFKSAPAAVALSPVETPSKARASSRRVIKKLATAASLASVAGEQSASGAKVSTPSQRTTRKTTASVDQKTGRSKHV